MASYWKSQPRKFCDVCKCWLSDNKASIEFHERGKSHKEKKERQIATLRKKSQQQWKNQQKAGQYLKQMEIAAKKKYKEDLRAQGVDVSDDEPEPAESSAVKGQSAKTQNKGRGKPTGGGRGGKQPGQKNSSAKKLPGPRRGPYEKCQWTKQTDSQGNVYYWNTETAESQWDQPKGYFESPLEIAANAVRESLNKAKETKKSTWTEQVSPDGNTYYWNTETGESQWVKPEGFVPEGMQLTPVTKEGEEPAEGETTVKRPRTDAYGGWSVVKAPKPTKQIDLQLPKKLYNPPAEGLIDRTALEAPEPEKPKFKEKVIKSLGDNSEGPTVFKKKGPGKQRSIRKRIEED